MVAAGYALYEYQVQRQQRHLNTGALTQAPHKDAHLFKGSRIFEAEQTYHQGPR